MGVRAFVDTNVFVYLYSSDDPAKRDVARDLLLNADMDLVLSAQVLNEFYVTVTRKITSPLSPGDARDAVGSLAELEVVPVTRNLVVDALDAGQRYQLSHWDPLIVEAASRSGCEILFTEDLSSGSILRGVTITNPFLGQAVAEDE
ncbi:PIN domain-containing protein [Acidimicrobiales bacterium]|jgi:predicted nucleic acid-binding protein|nr:PIN domain-containing protein [bacterium]MDB9846458.1 PIN domain-containing protein [Acidimicrobiales bacterium]